MGHSVLTKKTRLLFGGVNRQEEAKVPKTLDKCQTLEKELRNSKIIVPSFHKSKSTTDGKNTITYSETWVLFYGKIINCNSRKSTELEKEISKKKMINKIKILFQKDKFIT